MSEIEASLERTFEIVNTLGLHARAAALLVQTAQKYRSHVEIVKDELAVNGKSIMGVLMLAAETGIVLTIQAHGPDEREAVTALVKLIDSKFEEGG
jgi:phosphocarrier protein